jgi:pyrimidine operon attenuation protein/uracil phosphoribosyltransferase
MPKNNQILDAQQADVKLTRLSYEIYEQNCNEKEIYLVGIDKRGYAIASIIQQKLEKISKGNGVFQVILIKIKVDKENPIHVEMDASFNPSNKTIILIDDVANSGKTMLYALKPILEVIPKKIQTAVLVDRKHKLFPIASDFIGMQLSTTLQENIIVEVEHGKVKGAFLK